MKTLKSAPSILSADVSKMGEEVISLEKSGADIYDIQRTDQRSVVFGPFCICPLFGCNL